MTYSNDKGFTLTELIFASILIFLTISIYLAGCSPGRLKEQYLKEVRMNLHIIKVAVEKYALDNNGNYPQILIGGDASGWDSSEGNEAITGRAPFAPNLKQTNLKGGGGRPPLDPLINGGYLESYPQNPLIRHMLDQAPVLSGGVAYKLGSGDVRFGYNGSRMGNALDDPRFLWSPYHLFDQPDEIRLQPTRLINTMSQSAFHNRSMGSIHPANEINPFYSSGGIPDINAPSYTIHRWWPGQFFYRASGDLILNKPDDYIYLDNEIITIWEFDVLKFNRYILGAYGDTQTTGLDLIRTTTINNKVIQNRSGVIHDTYRRSPYADYPENVRVYMSPPEIFGGGGKNVAPFFPYLNDSRDFIYGAPDGHPDGILQPVFIDGDRTLSDL